MNLLNRGRLERCVETLWYGKTAYALLLQPFAAIFGVLVAARVGAYRRGWLHQERIPAPVIVVGNITAGGTGKTPVVAWLAHKLAEAGLKPGVVSRGYGGRSGRDPVMVAGATSVREVGDEALVLARQTGVPICVGADRVAAARHLLANTSVNVIIADDGLQHYRLARDLEIAVVDGRRGIGNGRMLPAGPLREPACRLAQVDVVLVNGAETVSIGGFSTGNGFELLPGAAVSLDGSVRRGLERFCGMRVWAVAGIGNPLQFIEMLKTFAIDPEPVAVADHGVVSLRALRNQQPWPVLMTEKDAVKYLDDPTEDIWYVPVDVQMSAPAETLLMSQIRAMTAND